MSNDGNQRADAREQIRQLLLQKPDGIMAFQEYMDLCLYDPEFGYYMRPGEKLGKSGDFYTSAHLGTIMGEVLASHFAAVDKQAGCPELLCIAEWGGGDGRMAAAILETLRTDYPSLYARLRYMSIERSPSHRVQQAQRLQAHADRCEWISDAEWISQANKPFTIVLANELLDAFPVRRLRAGEHGYEEMWVGWDEERQVLGGVWKPLADHRIRQVIEGWGMNWKLHQQFEFHEKALEWVRCVAETLSTGWITAIDYGDGRAELYSPHRMNGTFLCYRQHQAYDDPFAWPGEQDMTSHVPFDQCRQAAEEAGLREVTVVTQKQFLVDNGIFEKLQSHAGTDPFSAAARRNRSIRQLLLSDGMSELFKVMTARK
ncbi:SAM-dependent methyltransferase [Xylanibacillus composti]|uniref:SAM-dependent methyltransferase n=1 Tax=Xylanibacillus composti TaxID=1572762 RepID=A0A8J4H225_9BACL|nr:SAM-dependent methyltransferase [Xylanibacillus composti]MDT9724383.1 SAM-dependent methyltransferase [Xylanibacillus composti]GIQ67977.1 SAM-dependent methyltransferase [Xylanibacillus composti]